MSLPAAFSDHGFFSSEVKSQVPHCLHWIEYCTLLENRTTPGCLVLTQQHRMMGTAAAVFKQLCAADTITTFELINKIWCKRSSSPPNFGKTGQGGDQETHWLPSLTHEFATDDPSLRHSWVIRGCFLYVTAASSCFTLKLSFELILPLQLFPGSKQCYAILQWCAISNSV